MLNERVAFPPHGDPIVDCGVGRRRCCWTSLCVRHSDSLFSHRHVHHRIYLSRGEMGDLTGPIQYHHHLWPTEIPAVDQDQ